MIHEVKDGDLVVIGLEKDIPVDAANDMAQMWERYLFAQLGVAVKVLAVIGSVGLFAVLRDGGE